MKINKIVLRLDSGDCAKRTSPARVVLGRASREFVYKQGIGSPPESDIGLPSLSTHSLLVLCSPEALYHMLYLKVAPGPHNIYHSALSHVPSRTHVRFKTEHLQLCSQWQKKKKMLIERVLIAMY